MGGRCGRKKRGEKKKDGGEIGGGAGLRQKKGSMSKSVGDLELQGHKQKRRNKGEKRVWGKRDSSRQLLQGGVFENKNKMYETQKETSIREKEIGKHGEGP